MSADLLLTDAPQITANEMLLAKGVAETLHTHYPGYVWAVNVNGSVVDIRCMNVSGQMGYTLHIPLIYSASSFDQLVMKAGGEILERYRQRRGAIDEAALMQAPTDFAGRMHFDR